MGRFVNTETKVVVSVADDKDHRFAAPLWRAHDGSEPALGEGYAAMTVPTLRAEIERRNEGRADADRLPAEGKKADLVAALESDDRAGQ